MASEYFWPAAAGGSGGGTVTSVALTVPAFLSISGSPITSSGTLALSYSGTALPIANGGTGQTSAANAINALLPNQSGHSGEFLTTNGSAASWGAVTVPTLANNTYFPIRNAANDANINSFKADASDNLYFGEYAGGHSSFFQGVDVWFQASNNFNLFSGNNQFNLIANGSPISLGFSDASQSNYYRIKAASSMPGNFTQTLPTAGPTSSGQIMVVATSGASSFGGTDTVPALIDTAANGSAGSIVNTGAITLQTGSTNSVTTDVKTGGILIASGSSTGTHSPAGDNQSGGIQINTGSTVNGFSGSIQISSGASQYQSGDVTVRSGDGSIADDGYSGDLFLQTGVVTGTAESGNVKIQTGTADSAVLRGDIEMTMYRLLVPQTITPGGTTGAQTIDKVSGTVNFLATATSLVVTNNTVTTSSLVFAVVRTADATAAIKNVVPGSGSFTINLTAAATAETSVGFFVLN